MIRKLCFALLGAVLVAALTLGLVAWKLHATLVQPLQLGEAQTLEVESGDTPSGLFQRLERDGTLNGSFWLRLYWRLNLSGQTLHSGEYQLRPEMTARDMIGLWQRGEVVQHSLTIVEGWNFRQVRAALEMLPTIQQTLRGLSDAEIMVRLGQAGLHPEGRFFPDTYRFTRGVTDVELLQRAFSHLETVLAEEWAQRGEGLPYQDAYQALIMASIIEKETGVPSERGEIAGVFVRRLERGMLLQTDPTVIYGMGERYRGRITRNDLRRPTPYNTYTNSGLPPTPIAMVGREAIHAALHPAEGKSLYFVARGDGSHVFSDSLDEHNRAVREYQLKRRADYRSSPPPRQSPAPIENMQ
ncbi:aminodeoxychorismate lyase [Stutzerimonas stutzeri]|uniref:Endolytic murein transglycosylase n=1 Tax=Stutzerimonas stutzeri TaxID=316 RepID=W8R5N3_STUST|nr:endolytic transglycosylase MltG [Stutzerimonas stutzeri]AHL74848.1 aminodeoxychorismate lyase [Stutzerimonas stutzeri]MCQ4330863.1 endolytic transglycosylase MltG [Stutzerimonas stutzeri]